MDLKKNLATVGLALCFCVLVSSCGSPESIVEEKEIFVARMGTTWTGYFSSESECDREVEGFIEDYGGVIDEEPGSGSSGAKVYELSTADLDEPSWMASWACVGNAGSFSITVIAGSELAAENEALRLDRFLSERIFE